MSNWRWKQPADHTEVAERVDSKKYERQIGDLLDRASADENVDFDRLAVRVNEKAAAEKVERTKRKGDASA